MFDGPMFINLLPKDILTKVVHLDVDIFGGQCKYILDIFGGSPSVLRSFSPLVLQMHIYF